MPFVVTCAAKDLRRRMADPLALVIWLAMPLLIGGLMIVMLGGDEAAPTAKVLLVDEDDSVAGRLLGAAGGGNIDLFDVETVTRADGHARLDEGEASALVVLPAGFTDAVLDQTPATIELVRNPAQRILPAIVQTALEMLVELVHYTQQLFGVELRRVRAATADEAGFVANEIVGSFSGSVNDRLREISAWLLPPALTVEFRNPDAAEAAAGLGGMNFGTLFLPSMLLMAVLFIAQGMADDLWDEKEAGTLRRAVSLPRRPASFLAGKLVAGAIIMTAVGVASLIVLRSMGAVTYARMPAALAWTVFGGTALYCLFLAVQFLASSRRGASILSNVVLFPVMMLGGAFFPFEAMPAWMSAIGQWTPNGLVLVQFKALIGGTASPGGVALSALAVGAPAFGLFALCARLLGRRFAAGA